MLSVPVMTGIICEDDDADDRYWTDSWCRAGLYAIYHLETKTYSNIQHDYDWSLESGYYY